MSTYDQLCGALGMLKQNGVKLDWAAINEQMRDIGRRVGIARFGDPISNTTATGFTDPVHDEVQTMHRKYRDMCLERGLIERGYLFDDRDCVPIV
jgi:hypothetical protein